jgi:small subunit ribosomal protein S16
MRAAASSEVVVVKLRLKRFGRKNAAFWRINAIDSRTARDGKVLEELGFYDPLTKDAARAVVVNKARVEYWLKVGAQPSPTVKGLLAKATDSSTLVQNSTPAAAPAA